MFPTSLLNLTGFSRMNEKCPTCGLVFEVEPGFFTGAMFVSYGFVVAISLVTIFTLSVGFGDPPIWIIVVTATGLVLIFLPVIFRYSRVLFLFWFGGVHYQN